MNSLISQFVAVWMHPWDAMSNVKREGEEAGLVPSMIFVVVMGLLSGVITAAIGMVVPPPGVVGASKLAIWSIALVMPIVAFIGSFIGAFFIWSLVDSMLRGSAVAYKIDYRLFALVAAFSPIAAILTPIPKVGQYLAMAVNLWGIIVMIRGIIIVRDTPPVRTWVICGLLLGFLFVISLLTRSAALREFQAGGPGGLSGFNSGEPADDLGATSDDLEKQLQDLADKAKTEQKTEKAAPEQPKK